MSYIPFSSKSAHVEALHCYTDFSAARLLALGLELPENTFTDLHPFDDSTAATYSTCRRSSALSAHCILTTHNGVLLQPVSRSSQCYTALILSAFYPDSVCTGSYPYESEEDAKRANDVWFKGHCGESHRAK